MVNGLAWLNDLMVWLGRWVPRILLVRASHEGVRFGMGGAVVRLKPGVHVYWPIVQEVQLVSMALRSIETSGQVIDSKMTSLVILYRISDAVRVTRDLFDARAQIDMRVKAHAAALAADPNQVLQAIRQEFEPLGITIDSIAVTQRSWCLPIKNMNEWGQHEQGTLG